VTASGIVQIPPVRPLSPLVPLSQTINVLSLYLVLLLLVVKSQICKAWNRNQLIKNYKWTDGKVYDLLWVSSKQGGPLGLGDLLLKMGWVNDGVNYSDVRTGSYIACDGSDGAYSHVALGVGNNLVDAHNNARYHVTATYYTINAVYNPPSYELRTNYTLEEAGPLPEEQRMVRPMPNYGPSN